MDEIKSENIDEIIEKIEELIQNNKYDLAEKLCLKEEYKCDERFIFELIKIYRKKREYKKALELSDKYPLNEFIVSQKIKVYIAMGNFKEALKTCNKYSSNEIIQCQKVSVLIKMNNLSKALKLCNKYPSNEVIIFHKILILTRMNKLLEARELCNKYPNNQFIQKRKKYIDRKLGVEKTNDILSALLNKIYNSNITKEEIVNSKISDYEKTILLIAYYEKYNKSGGLKYVNECKKIYVEENQKKVLNKLFSRLSNKKNKFFDITLYGDLLKCEVYYNEIENIKNNIEKGEKVMERIIEIKNEQPKEKNITETKNEQLKEEVRTNHIISVQGRKINTKGSKNSVVNTSHPSKVVLIKDVFNDELTEIGKYIYAQMGNERRRKDAIKAWDNLEDLSYKKITDKEAVQKMIHLIKVHSSYCDDIKVNEKKYSKYL